MLLFQVPWGCAKEKQSSSKDLFVCQHKPVWTPDCEFVWWYTQYVAMLLKPENAACSHRDRRMQPAHSQLQTLLLLGLLGVPAPPLLRQHLHHNLEQVQPFAVSPALDLPLAMQSEG